MPRSAGKLQEKVLAVLRRHVPDDTYRFEAAQDYTGRNVYRSSLLRLEGMEALHGDALRAGHMDGVMAFARGPLSAGRRIVTAGVHRIVPGQHVIPTD